MRHRILALLLAAGMVFTLAACGGTADSEEPSDSPSASQSPEPSPTEPSGEPSNEPSESPSEEPSESPSGEPSEKPSEAPSASPTPSTPAGSETPAASASPTPTPTPTQTPEPSQTPEPTEPTPTPTQISEPSPEPSAPVQSDVVDLQKFYESLLATDPESEDYFNPDAPVEGDALASLFPGMEDISTKQLVIYQPMLSAVACEIALAEVENADDVQKVKDIFQARIDYQVGTDDEIGGAWYPATIEGWKEDSRIVSHGNYVMLIVWEDCDTVVSAFNALF